MPRTRLDARVAARALELRRPSPWDGLALTVAAVAAATSGPLSAAIAAPALAISFWRCLLGAAATAPFAWRSTRSGYASWSTRDRARLLLAGALLAAHFGTWITGVRLTSVAAATALVATQPVWALLLARRAGVRLTARTWTGIALALLGVVLVTGLDISGGAQALLGDLLALLGGIFAAAYVSVGERARQRVPAGPYNALVFAVAAVVLLVACLVARVPLAGYDGVDWLMLLALTVGPQLLGHALVNRVLRTTSASIVSTALLFEVPGAALIAAVWLGQAPSPLLLPALVLLFVGLLLVLSSSGRRPARSARPAQAPPRDHAGGG